MCVHVCVHVCVCECVHTCVLVCVEGDGGGGMHMSVFMEWEALSHHCLIPIIRSMFPIPDR